MVVLTPFSVDGVIVAALTTLLADSAVGGGGGVLSWALLVIDSVAGLAANVAVAEPTATGRVIAQGDRPSVGPSRAAGTHGQALRLRGRVRDRRRVKHASAGADRAVDGPQAAGTGSPELRARLAEDRIAAGRLHCGCGTTRGRVPACSEL